VNKKWQIVSNDQVWFYPPDIQLSTCEVVTLWGKPYESCLFYSNGNSEVVREYETQEQAIAGHVELEKKYGLKRCSELKI
jgi:hypothetical protein